jgi:hypothetical protein
MISIVIPWRDTGPARSRAKDVVVEALTDLLPDAELILADAGRGSFSRAASRNLGVRAAEDGVVVVCDADTIPQRQPLLDAIAAAEDGMLHLPFGECRALSQAGTDQFLDGAVLDECPTELITVGSQGGVLVMQAKAWLDAGGMDERFIGWGFEDVAFHVSVATLLGEPIRHEGAIHHLWHPSDIDFFSPTYVANRALCQQYIDAHGDPQAIRRLQEAP